MFCAAPARQDQVHSAPVSRSVLLVTANVALREHLCRTLAACRWSVRQAGGGAEALALLEAAPSQALLLARWLPDLNTGDLTSMVLALYPGMDVLHMDGEAVEGAQKTSWRPELLRALEEAFEAGHRDQVTVGNAAPGVSWPRPASELASLSEHGEAFSPLPGLVGHGAAMRELTQLIRLVAPRSTTVLIEGETGTGKEVVAQGIQRLSARSAKPMAILNCAAIPEALLEAELFGHARGAFTGAVGSRIGRIEAANGGTVFLDEIGEMPLALQAKLLRFLEAGEIQRVGDNEITHVDVRIIAATHQDLARRAGQGTFRLDLYHRLAVFPIDVPPLRQRREDLPELISYLLGRLTKGADAKSLSEEALASLKEHSWPGNVRELGHVLERALILASDQPRIEARHIRYRRREQD